MTTATVESRGKPSLRERVSAATGKKQRAEPKKARSASKRPTFGVSTPPAPIPSPGKTPAAEAATGPTHPQQTAGHRPPEQQAAIARQAILPAALASSIGLDRYIQATGYRRYLDDLLKDAGSPTDPVEVMLIEQLAVCHLRAAQLQGQAGQAESLAAIELYNAAAARLTAEFRKTALVLKQYRGR
jgi:hypothetical protein